MFISALTIVLLGVVSGKNTILYDKLLGCITRTSSNLQGTMSQASKCSNRAFKHCYQDIVTDSSTQFILHGSCGFIDSPKVMAYSCEWKIKTKQTVWIDILLFELYFVDFPCSDESVKITEYGIDQLYCGLQLPWKHYAIASTVSITFHSGITNKGVFQIYYQDGQPIQHKTHILPVLLVGQHTPLHDQHHFLTRYFLYFIVDRMQAIQANISGLSGSRVSIYDGPGVESQQKSVSDSIRSSSFIMLLIVHNTENYVTQRKRRGLFVVYRAINNVLGKCFAKEKYGRGNFYVYMNSANDKYGTHGCVWNVPSQVVTIIWSFVVFTGTRDITW